MITIYHNNRCGKSRNALHILEEKNIPFKVVEYLKEVPSVAEITEIVKKLGIAPYELIRTKEQVYLEQYKGKQLSDKEWIVAMHQHPILIERPIVINGNKAVVARPPERVLDIL